MNEKQFVSNDIPWEIKEYTWPFQNQGWDSLGYVIIPFLPLILTGLRLLVVLALSYFAGLFMPESVWLLHTFRN